MFGHKWLMNNMDGLMIQIAVQRENIRDLQTTIGDLRQDVVELRERVCELECRVAQQDRISSLYRDCGLR